MELPDWTRPHYQAGGGEPFLFYVVYGAVDLHAALSRGTYRSNGVPEGLDVMHYSASDQAGVLDGFREGYLWNELVGTAPEFAREIAAATQCVILRGTPADASNLHYLRDGVGLLTHFLDHGGRGIFDPQMFGWWQPATWRERVFTPAEPLPCRHVAILTSPEDEGASETESTTTWFHTAACASLAVRT